MALPPIGLPPLTVSACAVQPPTNVLVVAGVDPLATGSTFSFSQLRKMSKETNRIGNHPPYGFYFGTVALKITADIGNDARDLCRGPLDMTVTLRLTNRHIEVAQDLKKDPCRFPKIMAHYRHHAEADEAVFQRYVLKVTATLDDLPASSFAGAYGTENPIQNSVQIIKAAIEPVLRSMDAERDSARQVVDTPAEVKEIQDACTDHT